jgi:hypothetical protein
MKSQDFLISYINGCATGAVKIGECGPVWQLGVILTLLAVAVGALIVMRLMAASRQCGTPAASSRAGS